MKTLLTTALYFLMTWSADAQCDLHKKTDDFTNKTSVWTDKVKITSGGTPSLLKSYGDNCRYKIYFRLIEQNGKVFISMSENSDQCVCSIEAIALKFKDGKVIIKNNYKDGETIKTPLGEERFTFFEITNDELSQLSTGSVTKFRITEPGCRDHPVLEEEMEDAFATKILQYAGCVLQNTGDK
ncbi:hypothetical protein CJD36_004420 [Flavipsychrobacter stenotrophus]|uniref:Lipocalin-like domain-containing protein n=1 Tax=Flavipsychrobacter stenotrophus TaxID=2077091 RepID=A0A2S7T2H3_9BACT|nr:hypothetical protein [Flavipsychrobacter stenotrophus]PQJ12995.1 hypothetical protein CJD36_004420 [Flavipsychrobacter stenotrophus]